MKKQDKPPTVLLVEDTEDNRFMMRRLLEMTGYRVVEAEKVGRDPSELTFGAYIQTACHPDAQHAADISLDISLIGEREHHGWPGPLGNRRRRPDDLRPTRPRPCPLPARRGPAHAG